MFFSRGKNKIPNPYTFRDMYLDYIKDVDKDSTYYVTYLEYVELCSIFYQMIVKAIVNDGIKFNMPNGLGDVFVRKDKTNIRGTKPINWELTIKEGKIIYELNEHTGGYGYKFFWTKPYNIKNKFMYRLVFTRDNKRYLAKAIKKNNKDYFEK